MDIVLWKNNIAASVKDIADKDFQKKAWFNKGDQVSSPEEIYSSIFDDFLFEDFLNSTEVDLTDLQKKKGHDLLDALEEYSPENTKLPSPDQMIDDPKWDAVRKVANAFLECMK